MEEPKIEVPQFVNEWFLKNVNKHGLYELAKKLIDSPNREEEYVTDGLKRYMMKFHVCMMRFCLHYQIWHNLDME